MLLPLCYRGRTRTCTQGIYISFYYFVKALHGPYYYPCRLLILPYKMHGDDSPNQGDRLPRYSKIDPMPPSRVMPEIERAEETQSLLLEENVAAQYTQPRHNARTGLSDLKVLSSMTQSNTSKAELGSEGVYGSTQDPLSSDDDRRSFATSRSSDGVLLLEIAADIHF